MRKILEEVEIRIEILEVTLISEILDLEIYNNQALEV
jgi:hypothetical protein